MMRTNVASMFLPSFFWSIHHKEREHGAVVLYGSHALIRSYHHGCLSSFPPGSASYKKIGNSNSVVIEELDEKEEMKRS